MSMICNSVSQILRSEGREIPLEQAQIGAGVTIQPVAIFLPGSPEPTFLFFGTNQMRYQPSSSRIESNVTEAVFNLPNACMVV